MQSPVFSIGVQERDTTYGSVAVAKRSDGASGPMVGAKVVVLPAVSMETMLISTD